MTEEWVMQVYYVGGLIQTLTNILKRKDIDYGEKSFTIYNKDKPRICINLRNVLFIKWLTPEEYEAEQKGKR